MSKKLYLYLFIYVSSIAFYLYLNINDLKNSIFENAEYFLKNTAKSINFILPDEYLKKSFTPTGIDKKQFIYVNEKLNRYIQGTEIKKIYTLVYYGSDFFYTTYAEKNTEATVLDYFQKYTGEDNQIFDIYQQFEIKFVTHDNIMTAYVPQLLEGEKIYLICIDYSLDYFQKKYNKDFVIFFISSIFLGILTLAFLAFYRKSFQVINHVEKELKKVKEIKRELNKHKMFYEEKSKIDSLTKILNKEEINAFYLQKCKEFNGTPFVLMFLDLDKFKEINDTYGHPFGDKVLTGITREVNKRVRDIDAFGRIGGDEFMIVFCNTNLSRGKEVAKKIVSDINKIEFIYEHELVRISCSIGLLQYGGQDPMEFLKVVDEYLYKAKETRNTFATKE